MGGSVEKLEMKTVPALWFALLSGALWAQQSTPVLFGSALDADQQILESQQLAKALLSVRNPQRRAKGDQHRTYNFPGANKECRTACMFRPLGTASTVFLLS